jgi:hypothetical protein
MVQTQALLDMLLLMTHPTQYSAAVQIMARLRTDPTLSGRHPKVATWPSDTWQGISAIINRLTPPHRDPSGSKTGYDLLVSAGTAQSATLRLRDIGATLAYRPGTAVLITAALLTHEVGEWGEGDRICFAQWLRRKSLVDNHIPEPEWCTVEECYRVWEKLCMKNSG